MNSLRSFCKAAAHLRPVGPGKPLGYVCAVGLADDEDYNPRILEFLLRAQGLHTLRLRSCNRFMGQVGTLYVYHEAALRELLESRTNVLKRYGWSTDPTQFIQNIDRATAPCKTDLFDLIADAFNDKTNPGRTDCYLEEDSLAGVRSLMLQCPEDYHYPVA